MDRDPTTGEQGTQVPDGAPPALEAISRRRRRNDRQRDCALLAGTIGLLLAGFLVDVNAEGAIFVRGFPRVAFPVICPMRRFLGIPCPACGVTRSVVYLLHGRLADSFAAHRLGWLVLAVLVLQIPFRAYCLKGRGDLINFCTHLTGISCAGFLLLLVVNWLVS